MPDCDHCRRWVHFLDHLRKVQKAEGLNLMVALLEQTQVDFAGFAMEAVQSPDHKTIYNLLA